jgi:pimeloyl-ACP methyl ester carboxylesterase
VKTLRTPDERFAGLPGYGFAPRYLEHAGYRVHYLDEGPRAAPACVLCLHGNPTWSYLYRHMIPVFTAAGLRVVAPDLIGFGRSDKPADEAAHTWELHRGMLLDLVARLDLKDVLLVVQDWGGLFGLTLPLAAPERYTRALIMNTAFGTGELSEGFRQWRAYSNARPDLAVGALVRRGKADLGDAEAAAYDAPFPDATYKAALRAFPDLVPDAARDGADAAPIRLGREAERFWRERWEGAALVAIGMADPVLGPAVMRRLHAQIRNAPPPIEIAEAGHFVQEWGAPVARAALEHFGLARP